MNRFLTHPSAGATRQNGFTMIELLTVVAIVGIGSVLAVPAYLQWNARYELRQAAAQVTSQLHLARMAAMNRNRPVNVNLTTTSGVVHIMASDTGGQLVIPSEPMRGSVSTVTASTVMFSSLGLRASGAAGTDQLITLANTNGLTYAVRVMPSGKANWCPKSTCP